MFDIYFLLCYIERQRRSWFLVQLFHKIFWWGSLKKVLTINYEAILRCNWLQLEPIILLKLIEILSHWEILLLWYCYKDFYHQHSIKFCFSVLLFLNLLNARQILRSPFHSMQNFTHYSILFTITSIKLPFYFSSSNIFDLISYVELWMCLSD